MFDNQAPVCSFSSLPEGREAQLLPVYLLHFWRLYCFEINFGNWRWRMEVQRTAGRRRFFLILATTLLMAFVRLVRFPVFIRRIFVYYYVHGWFWHRRRRLQWSKRELRFPLSTFHVARFLLKFFTNDFATGRTNQNDIWTRLVMVSVKIEDLVQISMLGLKMSTNVPPWAISDRTISTE